MGKCANCGATLDPAWKFCISCGTRVPATEDPAAAVPESDAAESDAVEGLDDDTPWSEPIPGAIRPDPESDDEVPPARRADIPLIIGIVLGIGGVALIIFVAIALFTPRA